MAGTLTPAITGLVTGRLVLYLVLGGAGVLAVLVLVGGESLLSAVGLDPYLAGTIVAAVLTTAVPPRCPGRSPDTASTGGEEIDRRRKDYSRSAPRL